MSERLWITSHVERLLQDEWGIAELTRDADGDYPFRGERAAGWVQVTKTEPPMVRVFSYAAVGIKPSLAVLREINDIQCRTLTAQVRWQDGMIVVEQTISPIGLTRPVLTQALQAVMGVADDVGVLFAQLFGGSTPMELVSGGVATPGTSGTGEEAA